MKRALAAAMLALGCAPAAAVVGGTEEAGPARAHAAMILNSQGGMCSAVVLAPDVLMTAGHCVAAGLQYRAYFKGADGAPVLIEPAAKAVHPAYDAKAVAARRRSIDLALVRLREALPDSFAAATLSVSVPAIGAAIQVAGYGRAAEGDIRSNGVFRQAALTVIAPYGESRILVWAEAPGRGACEGDSGGPMTGAGGTVFALASWATGEGRRTCGARTQGVLVGPQRDWIDRVLKGWGRKARWE